MSDIEKEIDEVISNIESDFVEYTNGSQTQVSAQEMQRFVIRELIENRSRPLLEKIRELEKELKEHKNNAHQAFIDMDKALSTTQTRLKDANEVIGFYADRSNWRYSGEDRFNNNITFSDSSYVFTGNQRDKIGGKRAREYQSKYAKKSEG